MKYLTIPHLIAINQEMVANCNDDNNVICRIECFEVEPEDVADYHSIGSLEKGPFHSSINNYIGSYGNNPVYDLISYASSIEYPALKATIATSFPDYDFSTLCPWHFKIIKSIEQVKSNLTWEFASIFPNADSILKDLWTSIEKSINLAEVQIFKYEADGPDTFSDMGYITNNSYFFVDEAKNRVLFFHLREGSGCQDNISDNECDDQLDSRYGYGVF